MERLIKIKSGYRGNYDEYKYRDRYFVIYRSRYSNMVFEKPNLNHGCEIFKQPAGDYKPFIKKFKEYLNQLP